MITLSFYIMLFYYNYNYPSLPSTISHTTSNAPLKLQSIHLSRNWQVDTFTGASPGFGRGGGQEFFFSDLGICMSLCDMLRMAKPCALLGGFGGMPPREIFLKRCNLVRFRVYFDQILSLFFSKNAIFYIKNKYFRYTFVMGCFS